MSAGQTEVLTKELRDGSKCRISIIPDPTRPGDDATTLSWWLQVERNGELVGKIKARPREMAKPAGPGLTHGLTVKSGVAIGLTRGEADQIETALTRWVDDRKAAKAAAREELATQVRAAAPGAPTRTISSPYGVPGVGETVRLDDGSVVTSLRAWNRYYREDGMVFGAADDAGYVYFAEVREATAEESAPLLQRETALQDRKALIAHAEAEIVTPSIRPEDGEQVPDLITLPGAEIGPLVQIRAGQDALWVLRYNGADGDNWSYNNYRGYIATQVRLTPERSALFAELQDMLGVAR